MTTQSLFFILIKNKNKIKKKMLSNYLNKISKNVFDATNTHISIENPASNLFLKQVTVDITPQMRRIHEIFRETNRTKSKYNILLIIFNYSKSVRCSFLTIHLLKNYSYWLIFLGF